MSTAHAANPSQKPAHPCAGTQFAPVMMMAGGTGGHIVPALAVAKVLRSRGVPVVWLGADGAMETRLVPQHDIPLDIDEGLEASGPEDSVDAAPATPERERSGEAGVAWLNSSR